jgi:ubiquinone/menaquinone biosynthesis C-methylase UbiE
MTERTRTTKRSGVAMLILLTAVLACAQEESLSPKVNERFQKDPKKAMARFDSPNRDVVKRSEELLKACELKPGMVIADVGAGSGLHARLFAKAVAPDGKVYAVEIIQKMLDHIAAHCKTQNIDNIECVLCTTTSSELEPESVDLVFTCNTYHHFEYPFKMLASIRGALKPGGRLIVIDDIKKSNHVRADKATVIKEVKQSGFTLVDEKGFSSRNFLARFEKE